MSSAQLLASRDEVFEVVDPRTSESGQKTTVRPTKDAPRLGTLAGAVIGLIDNGMGSSSLLKEALVARLKNDYGVKEIIEVRKTSVSVAPTKEDWARIIDRADAAIAVFGGCGSCSARTVRDAIELEWENVPAVPVIHEAMAGSAAAMKRMSKAQDYQVVEVKYPARPTAIWSAEETAAVIDEILPQIVGRLVRVDS